MGAGSERVITIVIVVGMTVITVTTAIGRLDLPQRRLLAQSLTDAVLVPELGRMEPAARVGFQVHFVERQLDMMAIGGTLAADAAPTPDVITVDVAVMDADWRREVRAEVIEGVLSALAAATNLDAPLSTWWVMFRVIDEGSWGGGQGVTSILNLLGTGVFADEKAAAIRDRLGRSLGQV